MSLSLQHGDIDKTILQVRRIQKDIKIPWVFFLAAGATVHAISSRLDKHHSNVQWKQTKIDKL